MDRTIHQDKSDRIPIRSALLVMLSFSFAALLTSGLVFVMQRYAPDAAGIPFPLGCLFAILHAAVFYFHLRHISVVHLRKSSQVVFNESPTIVNPEETNDDEKVGSDHEESDIEPPTFTDNPVIRNPSVRFASGHLLSDDESDEDFEGDDYSHDEFLPHLGVSVKSQGSYINRMSKPPKDVLRHSKLVGSEGGRTSTVFLSDNENPGIEFYVDSSDDEIDDRRHLDDV